MALHFTELTDAGLIAARGEDAAAFLHAQVTSDVASLEPPRTQYSGYCTAQGRLLATLLIWRLPHELLLQLPRELAGAILARLKRYVLRARVTLSDACGDYRLFGLHGSNAGTFIAALPAAPPHAAHAVAQAPGLWITRLPQERYLICARQQEGAALHARLIRGAVERPPQHWTALDIEAGIPEVTADTQERYVPQMLNLDRIGAVSYSKGCYPGQEIVARTHYLGRLKQRMYRARLIADEAPRAGDPLFSGAYAEQASGGIVSAAPAGGRDGAFEVLAVVQTGSITSGVVRWKRPDGPALEFLDLPYPIQP
jgi:tRNA-modifying protein YgfZ